jgi:sec-independent protein translocase protein TatA
MSFPGGMEMLLVLAVVMLLFGAKKLPELARSMGRAGKEFKTGLKDGPEVEVVPVAGPCPFCETNVPEEAKFCPGCSKSADEIVLARTKPLTVAS